MSEKYQLRKQIESYITNMEATADKALPYMVSGSQNVLIDPRFGKFSSRGGYSRLGVGNTALTPVRQEFRWITSTGEERNLRWYDDELEAYLGTIDGVVIDAWTRIKNSLSTTTIPRRTTYWDSTELIDLLLFVQGDDNIYDWSGAVTTLASATANTLTKNGTKTWAESRFLTAGTRKVLINGTEYTYTGGETTTTLTGVTGDPSAEAVNSVVSQVVRTNANTPLADRNNHTIFNIENHILVGSDEDALVYVSKSTSFIDFTFSSPRVPTEGALLKLTGTTKGFGIVNKIPIIFGGKNEVFTMEFEQLAVGTVLTETLKIKKLKTGINQGAFNQETIVPVGDGLIYLTNEPALRIIETVVGADQPQIKALSNPIKPDFDDETWTSASAIWHKNRYYLSAPTNSKLYILEYQEDTDGTLKRFWQPPQILPIRCLTIISDALYGHSNAVPETYLLFTGNADGVYSGIEVADKLPIEAIAKLSYRTYGDRANLKSHDEFYVEGNISPATNDLQLVLRYDYGGATQESTFIIDGTNQDILYQTIEETSLGQQPLGTHPIGGVVQEPTELSRFRVIFEMPKEDYHELQEIYQSNGVDKSWEVISAGGNIRISPNKDTIIKL